MSVITLGGMSGAGARSIGPILAEKLGSDYVDRIFLTSVAKKIGSTVAAIQIREERIFTRSEKWLAFVQKILETSAATGATGDPYFGPGSSAFLLDEFEDIKGQLITEPHTIADDHYIDAVHDIMRDMAVLGDLVFVGRGGHVILNDMTNVLKVGVIAHVEDRVITLMRREKITEPEAIKLIASRDEARRHYFDKFFNISEPDSPELYHITINTSEVSVEYSTTLILDSLNALKDGKINSKGFN